MNLSYMIKLKNGHKIYASCKQSFERLLEIYDVEKEVSYASYLGD